LREKGRCKFYGISKDPASLNYLLVFDDKGYNQNFCLECQSLLNFFDWCKICKLNHFQLNYGEFPSRNNEIDMVLKDNYCESYSSKEIIEWVPYNEFKDITCITVNKEIYNAIWSKGYICDWDEDKFNWNRKVKKVALVNFKYDITDFKMVSYNTF
jgi:hypothetical protein